MAEADCRDVRFSTSRYAFGPSTHASCNEPLMFTMVLPRTPDPVSVTTTFHRSRRELRLARGGGFGLGGGVLGKRQAHG